MKCSKRDPHRPDLFCDQGEGHPFSCAGLVDADGKRYLSTAGVSLHRHPEPGGYEACDYCSGTPEWRATHQEEIAETNRWIDEQIARERDRKR